MSQNQNLCEFLVAFKGTIKRNSFRVNTSVMKEKICRIVFDLPSLKFLTRCVMHTPESNVSNFVIEYLCKIETEFKNSFSLACLSGAQMGLNHEKNGG